MLCVRICVCVCTHKCSNVATVNYGPMPTTTLKFVCFSVEVQHFDFGCVVDKFSERVMCAVLGCGLPAYMVFKALFARLSRMTCSVTYGNQCTWTKLFHHYCSTCKMLGTIVVINNKWLLSAVSTNVVTDCY